MNVSHPVALLTLFALFPAISLAQDQPKENLKAVGTFRGGLNGGFQLATDTNEAWNVKLPNKASEISFSGNADQGFLKPGMSVKFSAMMNKKGQVQGAVTSLIVFTPLEANDVGVWPEKGSEGGPSPLEGLFSAKEVEKEEPKVKGKGKKVVMEDTACRVGGTLKSLKAGRMIVSAGGTEVKCELAENAKIKVATSDLSFVSVGDKVEVEGWYYANNKQAGLWANQVSITAANPLQDKKKPKTTTEDQPKEKSKPDDKEKKDNK